ncbi:MAG: hypothetical protein ACW990_05525 [Promethearchaeota archaeon]|jgi:hypothetical protein
MTNKACAKCEYWRRDGVDGICFYGPPKPKIVENNKEFIVMWPKTKPDEFCSKCNMSEDLN